jgi:hypothetical protein
MSGNSRTVRFLAAIVVTLYVTWTISAQTATEAKFQIEIQANGGVAPKFSIKNLSTKTLIACTVAHSVSSEARSQGEINWNSFIRADHGAKAQAQGPLEPGESLTFNLPHVVGHPFPDKVEIIAGIWADGETFGQPLWVKSLLDMNASMASAYEMAIALLQEGIDHNWTSEQYLAALNGKPASPQLFSIRQSFLSNPGLAQHPQLAKNIAQKLLDHFQQDLQLLRPQKSLAPATTPITNP